MIACHSPIKASLITATPLACAASSKTRHAVCPPSGFPPVLGQPTRYRFAAFSRANLAGLRGLPVLERRVRLPTGLRLSIYPNRSVQSRDRYSHRQMPLFPQPDSSSFRRRIRECLSTSTWMSLIFIFSRSSCNSLPSSAPTSQHLFRRRAVSFDVL